MGTPELDKFAELRAKTDRELIEIIRNALELAFQRAEQVSTVTDCDSEAEAVRAEAEKAFRDASRLLPLVYDISESKRRRFETKLGDLRKLLDGACQQRGMAA